MPTVKIWFTRVGVLFQLQKLRDEFTAAFQDENRYRVCHRRLERALLARLPMPSCRACFVCFLVFPDVVRAATQGAGHPRRSFNNVSNRFVGPSESDQMTLP